MIEFTSPNYLPALPEIFLGGSSLILLMIGVFIGNKSTAVITWITSLIFLAALVIVLVMDNKTQTTFGGLFIIDTFSTFMKSIVLIGAAMTLIVGMGYVKREGMNRFEFPILILFATTGMLLMISANDLIALYVGLEMQSLSLYIVATFKRESVRSTESGLKYFVLGALSSGLLLYGASLVYGFSGATNFEAIGNSVSDIMLSGDLSIGLLIGLVFIAAALAFKVSAVPFHMWTPDVYEGAPTPVTAFFSAAPKIAAMAVLIRIFMDPFYDAFEQWQQIIIFISIASMVLGAFAAILQKNIKRLLAYSSIGHVGYALVGLAAGSEDGIRGVLVYLAIYMVMTIGAFGCVLAMRRRGQMIENIDDLAGLSKSNPAMAIVFSIFMFSMAGIPPLAGFFGKLYVFMAAVNADLIGLAIIGVLTSVVGAYYYIRIVKVIYFDKAKDSFDKPIGIEITAILGITGIITALFFAYPSPILEGASAAALSIIP
ncbi:MAG: NADH-quinone oxidoreductase subunit NuoN [Gammaproteobacteria bacterium]|nr:NADH-quinone oxidoreductase subunit NuoN [Gammaproteobacteria bacterium]